MPFVFPFLDPANYGGLKGTSTNHYLINILNFTHANLDKPQPHAILLAQVDLAKAFNRVSHQHVILDLYDMHLPRWLLRIMVSFLTKRNMVLRYKGVTSSRYILPGPSPQGVFLGVLIFILIFNGAFLRPEIPRGLLDSPTSMCGRREDPNTWEDPNNCFTAKYIDDSSHVRAINLRDCAITDKDKRSLPLTYHQRMGHYLPPDKNLLQANLDSFVDFTKKKQLKINDKKSSVMLFNFSRSVDFPPELFVSGNQLQVFRESRILGLTISD